MNSRSVWTTSVRPKRLVEHLGEPLVLAIIALALAFLFTWSAKLCVMHNADSILPALISRQNVTWYYWGQNRLGNLLPALTSGISDLELNLEVQVFLRAFFASIGFVFFILILRPKARVIAVFSAILAAMMFIARDFVMYGYWTDALPYGTSLAILVAPLVIATRSSWRFDLRSSGLAIVVLFLLMVALWVNLSAVLFVLPLFLGLAVVERSKGFLVVAVLTLLAYELDSAHAAHVGGSYVYANFRPSWAAIEKASSNLAEQIRILPAALLAAGAACAVWRLRWRHPMVRTALVMVAVAVVAFIVTANLEWVQDNLSLPRYVLIPIAAIVAASATLIVEAMADASAWAHLRNHLVIASFSFTLLVLAVTLIVLPLNMQCRFVAGLPKVADVAGLVRQTNASFVDGDYWIVWPAVYLANRDLRRPVFGLAFRAEGARRPIRKFVAAHPHPVILCIGKPLTDCVGRFTSMMGWTRASAREIATGELANSQLTWVAGALDYGFADGATPH